MRLLQNVVYSEQLGCGSSICPVPNESYQFSTRFMLLRNDLLAHYPILFIYILHSTFEIVVYYYKMLQIVWPSFLNFLCTVQCSTLVKIKLLLPFAQKLMTIRLKQATNKSFSLTVSFVTFTQCARINNFFKKNKKNYICVYLVKIKQKKSLKIY